MMELYINEYPMDLKRVKWKGHISLIGTDGNALKNTEAWQGDQAKGGAGHSGLTSSAR